MGGKKEKNKKAKTGLPHGSVVKNLPTNAGHTASIPDPGRSYVLQTNEAQSVPTTSLRSRARELKVLKPTSTLEPVLSNKRRHRNEKPAHRSQRKASMVTETRHGQKINK